MGKNIRPLDIVDVKAGIRAGRLFIQVKDNHLLLGDFQTGEAVSLSDIEVKPVVHARWIMNHFGAKCSHCLRLYCIEPSWSEKIKHMPPTWIYCPNCGAKMDGESDDDSC